MKRENFNSRIGFILVSAGCAIGIGNVWKFPYLAGQNGGGYFVLFYLLFLIIMGIPVMTMELAVGRASRKSAVLGYKALEPAGSKWHWHGWACVIGCLLLMMYYTTVSGWMLAYFFKFVSGAFTTVTAETSDSVFANMLGNPVEMGIFMAITVAGGLLVCSGGVQKGLEKVTKIMMLLLLGLIVILAVHSTLLPGAGEGIRFYLVPDFHNMLEKGIGNVIFGAMSQAFFTLSIGMGSMAIFGSYLDKSRSLTGEALSITILDTFVALMAGLIIIPACFAYGIEPDAGPSLIFITLPNIFNQMTGGRIWGSLFFLFLSFAALSTVIAVFENIISFAIDLWGWSRKKAVIVNILAIIVLSMPCVLGYNLLSGFHPLGSGTTIMDLEDFLISSNVLPLGSLVYVMFCTTWYGWGFQNFLTEADAGNGLRFPHRLRWHMTYIIPVVVVFIYLKGYYDLFAPQGLSYLIPWMCIAVIFLLFIFSLARCKNNTKH